jgi:hypothetical protein
MLRRTYFSRAVTALGPGHRLYGETPDHSPAFTAVLELTAGFDLLSQLPVRGKCAGIYQAPEEVVEEALRVLANGGGLTVPGALNKFSVFAQRLIPRKIVPRLVAKLSKA